MTTVTSRGREPMDYDEAYQRTFETMPRSGDLSNEAASIREESEQLRAIFQSKPKTGFLTDDELDQIQGLRGRARAEGERDLPRWEADREKERLEYQEYKRKVAAGEAIDEEEWTMQPLETVDDSSQWIGTTEKWFSNDPLVKEHLPAIKRQVESGDTAEEEIGSLVRLMELRRMAESEYRMPEIVPFNGVLYHGSAHTYDIPQPRRAPVDTIHTPKAFYLTSDWSTAAEYAHESSYEGDDLKARVYEVEINALRMADCSTCNDQELVAFSVLKAYDDGLDGVLVPATTSPLRGLDPVPEVLLFRPDESSRIIDVHVRPEGWGDDASEWDEGVEGEDGRLGPPHRKAVPNLTAVQNAVSEYKRSQPEVMQTPIGTGYQGAPSKPKYIPRSGRGKIGH